VRFDVSVHNVIVVAVAQRFCDLPHVVAAKKKRRGRIAGAARIGVTLSHSPGHRFAVHKTCHGAAHDLKAQVGAVHAAMQKRLKFRTRAACLIG